MVTREIEATSNIDLPIRSRYRLL